LQFGMSLEVGSEISTAGDMPLAIRNASSISALPRTRKPAGALTQLRQLLGRTRATADSAFPRPDSEPTRFHV
jgi:hypothetical protein